MTVPSFVSLTASTTATDQTSHTCTLPTTADGDGLILLAHSDNNGGGQTFTWPAGYTEFFDSADTGEESCVSGAYRDCDGTEPGSITVTTGNSQEVAFHVWRLTDHDMGSTAPEISTINTLGGITNPDPASLNPTGWDGDTYWIAMVGWWLGTSTITGWPTNYNDGQTSTNSSGDSTSASIATAGRGLSANSEDPGAFTVSTAEYGQVLTIAVPGAVAGGGGIGIAVRAHMIRGIQ